MNRRKKFVIAVLLTATLLLSSCIDRLYGFDTDVPTGVPLTPEMIDSIIDAATVEQEEKYPVETDANGALIVYWLPDGSVWHASPNCSSVQRSDPEKVGRGSVLDAISDGKDRPCKICAKDIEYDLVTENTDTKEETDADITDPTESKTSKYPKHYSEDGRLLVYWTKNGSVWHESISCPSLANTEKDSLISGSEDDAVTAGKERACKKCS